MIDTREPRFTLPGADEKTIEWLGYGEGLYAQVSMFFDAFPPDVATLPTGYITTMPTTSHDIANMAKEVSELVLTVDADEQPVTNNPDLYQTIYQLAFIKGYRFNLYAFPRGLPAILWKLAEEDRHSVVNQFAYELVTGEPAKDDNSLPQARALSKLQSLHDQYRKTLN